MEAIPDCAREQERDFNWLGAAESCRKALNLVSARAKPRVLYTDETGSKRSRETKPIMLSVKELGIKGWLKGER